MINDKQYRRLKQLLSKGKNLNEAALKSRMDEKTARKYREQGTFPSELKMEHTWRTRKIDAIYISETLGAIPKIDN